MLDSAAFGVCARRPRALGRHPHEKWVAAHCVNFYGRGRVDSVLARDPWYERERRP